jgi:hypothetical protein
MPQEVQVGTILMSEWPEVLGLASAGLESEAYSGHWRVVKALESIGLDRKVRAAGWNFFFIASEVKVMFFGAIGAERIRHAIDRILDKVRQQHFNGLEVTGIVVKRFLGLPYTVVSAHSRHVQKTCYLDSPEVRSSPRPSSSS